LGLFKPGGSSRGSDWKPSVFERAAKTQSVLDVIGGSDRGGLHNTAKENWGGGGGALGRRVSINSMCRRKATKKACKKDGGAPIDGTEKNRMRGKKGRERKSKKRHDR